MNRAMAKARRKEERRKRDARRGRLGPGRYDALVAELVRCVKLAFEAGATGSLFGMEGPLRHEIRSDLCLQAWGWAAADLLVRDLLSDVFNKVGAERPAWNEGQPEWVIESGTLIERTRCVNCSRPLLDGRKKFCSDLCANTHHARVTYRKEMTEERILATVSNWI